MVDNIKYSVVLFEHRPVSSKVFSVRLSKDPVVKLTYVVSCTTPKRPVNFISVRKARSFVSDVFDILNIIK